MGIYDKAAVFAAFFVRKKNAPNGSENALVVRNIPSGVQQVTVVSGGGGGTVENIFNQITAVATNSTETIITFTAPNDGKTRYILRIDVSGTNIGQYDILLNSAEFARKRTMFGANLNESFNIGSSTSDAYQLSPGDIIQVTVTNPRPSSGNYEARLQYLEV